MKMLLYGLAVPTLAMASACQFVEVASPDGAEPEPAAVVQEAAVELAAPALALPPQDGRDPYVIIRFDQPDVEFEDPLSRAVSAAVERKPEVAFDLLALAPAINGSDGGANLQNIERVLRVITEMGVPTTRIALWSITSSEIKAQEIRVFLR